jgi:outer membrane usher protein
VAAEPAPEHEQGEFKAPPPSPPTVPQEGSKDAPAAGELESAIEQAPPASPPPETALDQKQDELTPSEPDPELGDVLAPSTAALAPQEAGNAAPDQESGDAATTDAAPLLINDPHAPPASTVTPPQPPVPVSAPVPAALPPKAAAEVFEPELPFAMQAPFDLFVNEVHKGQIIIALAEDDVLIRPQDLSAAGISPLEGRTQVMFEEHYLSLKSVSPPLSYVLDDRAIALRIIAPVDLLPRTNLDLGTTPSGVIHQAGTSGFLNYSARMTDFEQVDLYQEIGASHDGNLAFSSMYMSSVQGPTRGLTYYAMNERQTLRRVTFGDTFAQTGALGSASFVGGVSLARTFDLDPYLVTSPRIGFSGSTLTPSTVDVYINGALVRSEQIAPGSFQLNNLRVTGGRGQATYVIRDVFGREQRIDMPFYMSGSVLAKDLEEYEYTIGAMRENVGTESFGYDRIAFLGRHRIGVTNDLTISGRAEATTDVLSAGPSLTALTPIGQIEVDLGASYERDRGAGGAGFLSYSFLSRYFSGGLFGRALSTRYATLNTPSTSDHILREFGLFQSTPVLDRLTLSSQAQFTQYSGRERTWRVSASTGTRLISHLMFLTYGSLVGLETDDRSWEVFGGLSYVFGQRHSTSLQTRLRDRNGSLTLDANKSLPVGVGYGYRGSVTFDEANSASAAAQYQTSFGRYGTTYTMFDNEEHHVAVEASGAIAIVPGIGVFPTLPVQDAFGVIRVAGVKNVRGYINNQEIGKTDRNGNLVVPNLLSYYGNRLSISSEDVPIRYTLQTTERAIAPPQRGVAVADFPVSTPHFYRGVMRVRMQGNVVVPKHGQLRVRVNEGETISPLGDLAEFELADIPSGKQTVWVDFLGGSCEMELDFPDLEDVVIELGEISCEMP